MSKSKEQCIHIIAKRFTGLENEENPKVLSMVMEESIKEISESEYGLFWIYEKDRLINLSNDFNINMNIGKSLFKSVLESKKSFFDNHIASHKLYNKLVDNPFGIRIKSMLIVPLMDRMQEKVVGFISVFNSIKNGGEFQRYDIRSLTLLNSYALKIMALRNAKENNLPLPHFSNDILLKSSNNEIKTAIKTKVIESKPAVKKKKDKDNTSKSELIKLENELKELRSKMTEERLANELLLKESQKKVELLEKDLLEERYEFERALLKKAKSIEELEKKSHEQLILVEDEGKEEQEEIVNIFKFLNNEVSYLSNESHHIYLFLEIIKNSLYNKDQLLFVEEMLNQSELVSFLANELYTREKMPTFLDEFNPLQTFHNIANLYARSISADNIGYNVFIDPQLPKRLISDVDKLKSIIVHLMNNIHSLVNEGGLIECIIGFSEQSETLKINIQGFKAKENVKKRKFFKQKKAFSSHSLVSSDKGLGLSVSSGLIHHLDGRFKLETLEKEGKSFSVMLPVQMTTLDKKQKIISRNRFKIGILMGEEHQDAYKNLQRYFDAFKIPSSDILFFESYEEVVRTNLTHLFCFEEMYHSMLKKQNIEKLVLLKYAYEEGESIDIVEELIYNGYYGTTLQKILFPLMEVEELEAEVKLLDDSFLTKLNKVVKRLKRT